MPEQSGQDLFQERVNIILDELRLGIQWGRPSLITAVYRSEHIKNRLQTRLAKSLETSGTTVLNYRVDKTHYDIPLDLMNHRGQEHIVFFICGLHWGGGRGYSNTYRALNMHREHLVEGKIKAVFWLTEREARQTARFSPDFWAFRHLVVEFLDLPTAENVRSLPTRTNFHDLYLSKEKDLQTRIESAERLYALGCIDDALLIFHQTLRKYPEETALYLQMAEIHLAMRRIPAARRMLAQAGKRETGRVHFLREYYNLRQAVKACQPAAGGISERTNRPEYDPGPLS